PLPAPPRAEPATLDRVSICVRSVQVELAVLGPADERLPLTPREQEVPAGGVLGVADGDALAEEGHLDAVVASIAAHALAPLRACQLGELGLVGHHSSLIRLAITVIESRGDRAEERR